MPAKENLGDVVLATKGLPKRRSDAFIKVSGQMRNNAFKSRLVFSCNNFSLKQLSTNIKAFHYYGTGV